MTIKKQLVLCFVLAFGLLSCLKESNTKEKGQDSIKSEDLRHHLEILASDAFNGRNTPSPELKIAARYLAQQVKKYGLNSINPDGSYYQNLPLRTASISENLTNIKINHSSESKSYQFLKDFGIGDAQLASGTIEGEVVFLGLGFRSIHSDWDNYGHLDVRGKIALILDADLPEEHPLKKPELSTALRTRADTLIKHGAIAVLKIISPTRELFFKENQKQFLNPLKARVLNDNYVQNEGLTLKEVQLRHGLAANLLGISQDEINEMFLKLNSGTPIKGIPIQNTIDISVVVDKGVDQSQNVIALLEGSDSNLKDEYLVYGAHYDHIGITESGVYNGANDNGSGTVGLLELAQAMAQNRPKRSILFIWFTGEEKGLWGSEYFTKNPVVPLEKISACINLDVISGHDLDKITVSGGDQLSSGFSDLLTEIGKVHLPVRLDFLKENPRLANFFFIRSDHYPFLKNGIPAVWFGAHSDHQGHIHKTTDIPENINYEKMKLITQFAYLLGMEVANYETLMPLDKIEEITKRGSHNQSFDWIGHRNGIEN